MSQDTQADRSLRTALRVGALATGLLGAGLLFGADSIGASLGIVHLTLLRGLGAVLFAIALLVFGVSRQASISLPHVLYLTMPRVLIALLLIGDAITGFLFASSQAAPLSIGIALVLLVIVAWEQMGVARWKRAGVAIFGYDPVAFFTDQQPVIGKAQFAQTWQGKTWYFASEEHRRLFTQSPEKYAPAHSGECSFGHTLGMTFDSNPRNWDIVNGQLHLNSSGMTRFIWRRLPAVRRTIRPNA
jgi:YHS domain-containing protein